MTNPLALSDEDFLKQPLPETGEASSDAPQNEENKEQEKQEDPVADPEKTPDIAPDPAAEPEAEEQPAKEEAPVADPTGSKQEETPAAKPEEKKAEEPKAEKPDGAKEEAPNYQAFYDQVMKPFTANGKEITLKTPEEAVQLMQMGANYTRKMQELAPHRKLLAMIQNNKLDEDKLSFLIDLDKKDPEAIKKLIKDSGTDPLDIDTNTEPAYRGGSHKVTDNEVEFQSQLDELGSNPEGKATLQTIDQTWDQSSKEMLWQHPEVMSVIHEQTKAGIYAKIVAEMDRQKTLGQLKAGTPFLEAYQTIGNALHASGAFGQSSGSEAGKTTDNGGGQKQEDPKPDPTPVATTKAAPKADDAAARAAAAAAPRTTPKTATEAVNFLSMSDEDFAKQFDSFAGRV